MLARKGNLTCAYGNQTDPFGANDLAILAVLPYIGPDIRPI